MSEKLFEIELQGSLEYNGVSYQPGEIVSVPEDIYDYLVNSYLKDRQIEEKQNFLNLDE